MRLKAFAAGSTVAGLLAAVFLCGKAEAGAWPTPDGQTQAILKYERQDGDTAFDADGLTTPIPERTEESVSLFVEHGLTARITLQGKAAWTRGSDPFFDYSGRGPIELGVRYAVLKGPRTAVSLYLGAVLAGEGRNAGYANPGAGQTDAEVRLLAGRSGVAFRRPVFAEVQVARLARQGLPDETRVDTTMGFEVRRGWLLLAQTYAGRAEADPAPMWLKSEAGVVRSLGDWRLQAGWRGSLAGVDSPVEHGPVFGIWRTF